MKITTVRQSGKPVFLEKLDEYDIEFRQRYDEILEECGTDMQKMHGILEMLDNELSDKYDTLVKLDFPTTKKAIKSFVDEYGSYMISTHKDTNEPMMVIMDIGI